MNSSNQFTVPAVCPKQPKPSDLNRPWYVFFRFFDPATEQWVLIKEKKGINRFKNFKERVAEANALCEVLHEYLKDGWNPITKAFDVKATDDPFGQINELSKIPFKKAIDFALQQCNISARTLANYRNSAKRIMAASRSVEIPGTISKYHYNFSTIPVDEISRKHIKILLDHCKQSFGWSNKAYNKHMGYFKSILSRLVECEVIANNPAHGIKCLAVTETRKYIPYTEEEKKQIREHLYLHHYGFFVILMIIYNAGMRPNEVLALRPSDIDLNKRLITVVPDRQRDNSKTKNIRHIPISDSLYALIREWLKHDHRPDDFLFGSPYESGKGNRGAGANHADYFKPSKVRIKRDTLTKFWKKVVIDGLKIKKYMYAGKHSGADAKILAGISVDALQSMYGHSSKYMTLKYITELKEIHANEIRQKSPEF